MGWLWGKKISVNAKDKAILDIKIQRDKVKQYQKRIQVVIDREHELAKQCLQKGDKQRALILLRRKKFQETILVKTDKQLTTLEELVSEIEFAQIQKDVVYGLEQGNKVLKEINNEISLERVERIMDESAEGIAYQKEVSEALGTLSTLEEEEVEDELEQLESEMGTKVDLPDVPKIPTLPDAPSQELPEQEQARQAYLA